MNRRDIFIDIGSDADGANGKLDRNERIKRTAGLLVDRVFEGLLDYGIGPEGYGGRIDIRTEVYRAIERVIAGWLVDQRDYCAAERDELIAWAANGMPIHLGGSAITTTA